MLKERIVGTGIGRVALGVRDRLDLWRTVLRDPEQVGTVGNDQLATRLVTALCSPGKIFVDVGAHIGSIVAAVQHHDRSIRIVAIEAVPEKAARLQRRFPGVEVHNCAAGESERTVSFFVDLKRPGYSSLDRGFQGEDPGSVREITVPLRRLDAILTSTGIDVIKVDVEGAELRVFQGGEQIIARERCVVMFESAPGGDPDAASAKASLWNWLDERGYCVVVPNRVAHDGAPLSREGFVESHDYPRRTTNYFAIPRERRIEIRDRARRIVGIR